MVVDVGVEVKGGVLQYTLREEGTMGRETEHDQPVVEFEDRLPRSSSVLTIGEDGVLGCIYEVQIGESDGLLAQLVEGDESGGDTRLLVDPRDGVTWSTGRNVDDAVILKRYNARLVLTEVK